MNLLSLLLKVFSLFLIVSVINGKKKTHSSQCSVCKEIATNFMKGVERTKKSNYGGGNTDWEETRLGQYANSEVRLTEIMEHLCESSECHQMVEEHEKYIDEFWFKPELERTEEKFYNYFCIENVKVCCPENTFGPECKPCLGGKDRPCRDNGKCVGGGTRAGTGKCKCNSGYNGQFCEACNKGYYQSDKNDTHTTCKVCDISCKTSCKGDGPTMCDDCKTGFLFDEQNGCQDINECDSNPCHVNSYCTNTQGSYSCMSCNVACDGCSGSGPEKCVKCNRGYRLQGGKCVDIDECSEEGYEDKCTLEGQKCENTVGTYRCVCQEGYTRDGAGCKPEVKDEFDEEEEGQGQKKTKKGQKEGDKKTKRRPQRRGEGPLTMLIAFFALAILSVVVCRTVYLLHPFLVSIPVALFAFVFYYIVKDYD